MLDLPEIGEEGAAAASVLAPRLPLRFAVAGQTLEAAFPHRGAAAPPAGWARIPGRIAGHPLLLEISRALLPEAALAAFPGLAEVGAPAPLGALLLDLLLAELGDAVAAAGGERPAWGDAAEAPLPHRLLLSAAAPPGDLLALLHLSDGALAWVARRAAALPAAANDLAGLPVRGLVLLDRILVAEDELRALAPGDVLLLERDPAGPKGALAGMLALPGRGFRIRLAGPRLELLSDLDAPMTEPDPPAPSMDGLRLPVEVTLGTLELPLARLGALAVGDVLDMGAEATARVTLRVNGQAVASGELVRIAGRTGVRITEVALARAPQ